MATPARRRTDQLPELQPGLETYPAWELIAWALAPLAVLADAAHWAGLALLLPAALVLGVLMIVRAGWRSI